MPEPKSEVLQVTEQYRAALRAREAQAVRQLATAYAQVARQLAIETVKLSAKVEKMRAAGLEVSAWRIAEMERYREVMAQVEQQLVALGAEGARMIDDLRREAVLTGVDMAEAQVLALIPPSVSISFNRLSLAAIETMTGFLAQGAPLARLLEELGSVIARQIGDLLLNGLALGWNPRVVARLIRRQTGMALTRALRIARTEQLRAWRISSIQGYRDQGSLIKGYRRHAQADDRTCIACLLLDGTFYELQENFTDHIQGRCAILPVTRSWQELGFVGIPDTNPEWQAGRDWFLEQNEGVQQDIIGAPLYTAWQGRRISLDDMTTLHSSAIWGDAWGQASLQQALQNAASRRLTP